MKTHITAIVVARGGSVRLPRKAMLPFGSSTLIGHKVDQLKQCRRVDAVVVGSDDAAILAEAERHGASIRRRDAYHCDEARCSANDMIRNMAAMVETDIVVWAHPTNPLVQPATYDRAVEAFLQAEQAGGHDSLLSVVAVRRHAWVDGRPFNYDPWAKRHALANELAPIHFQDGAIFIQRHRAMLRNAYFFGRRPLLFEMPEGESWDIDTAEDYAVARALEARRAERFPRFPEPSRWERA